jgi:hypothetical protein
MKKLALVAIFLAAFGVFEVPRAFSQETIYIYMTGKIVCSPSTCTDSSGFVFSGEAAVLSDTTCSTGVLQTISIAPAVAIGANGKSCSSLYNARAAVNLQTTETTTTDGCDTYIIYTSYVQGIASVESLFDIFVWQATSTTYGCDGSETEGFTSGTKPC